MKARARFAGHAIHPMLIPFPMGLLTTAVVLDVVELFADRPWLSETAFVVLLAGVIAGPLAAFFGWMDWFRIPAGTRARRVGLVHGVGNGALVALFFVAWLLRYDEPAHAATGAVLAIEVIGAIGLAGTGWLGGELVERLGIGVDPGARADAPSSLEVDDLPEPYPADRAAVTASEAAAEHRAPRH